MNNNHINLGLMEFVTLKVGAQERLEKLNRHRRVSVENGGNTAFWENEIRILEDAMKKLEQLGWRSQ